MVSEQQHFGVAGGEYDFAKRKPAQAQAHLHLHGTNTNLRSLAQLAKQIVITVIGVMDRRSSPSRLRTWRG